MPAPLLHAGEQPEAARRPWPVDDLEEAMKGSDPQVLREKLDDLNDATADLASRMADGAITGVLKEKTIDEAKDMVK